MAGRKVILGRVSPISQLCPRCGRVYRNHPGENPWACDVTDEVIRILKLSRGTWGRTWRAEVLGLWKLKHCPAFLIPARDQIGPLRLRKIDLDRA